MGWHSLRLVCAALLGVRLAGAASPAPQVAFSDCESEPLGKQAFLKALALELGRGQLRESSPESAAIVVTYRCDGIAHVQIRGAQSNVLRDLRTDDVTLKDRVRALALAVAELARAGSEGPEKAETASEASAEAGEHPSAVEAPPEPAKQTAAKKASPAPSPSRAPGAGQASIGEANPSASSHGGRFGAQLSFALRFNLDVEELYYGAALGAELSGFRLQIEGLSAHATTTRGSVTSGLLALRLGRALPLVRFGVVETGLVASVAAGGSWALGSSSVPYTLVRRVLMPYVDARVGLWATSSGHIPFTPLCEVYVGRGAGIVALADGARTLSTDGWFTGGTLGLWL